MSINLDALWPQITVAIGACACLGFGIAGPRGAAAVPWLAGVALVAAATVELVGLPGASPNGMVGMSAFVNPLVCGMGLLLVMLTSQARTTGGSKIDDPYVMPTETVPLMLLSLVGVMLCASAQDLVWLFLALELTSLPTYVIVATSRRQRVAQEAGVKYFFLGALAAAVFLYGFAMLYGATGATAFTEIRQVIASQIALGEVSPFVSCGLALSILGICFKIAAVPMHAYVADVYQGAAAPVTAMLAFVPKTAGFAALFAIVALTGAEPPAAIQCMVWIIAVTTMTVGNVLGLVQKDVKRVLAYSSIAHSGYMLVGLIAASSSPAASQPIHNGMAAVLFYLVGYGLATTVCFGVLGALRNSNDDEVTSYEGIAGLVSTQPRLAALMLVGTLSLLGFPLTVGFLGKIYLFGAAMSASHRWLVAIAVLNSAIAAVYYLRIAAACYFGEQPTGQERRAVTCAPATLAITLAGLASVALFLFAEPLANAAHRASPPESLRQPVAAHEAEVRGEESSADAGH